MIGKTFRTRLIHLLRRRLAVQRTVWRRLRHSRRPKTATHQHLDGDAWADDGVYYYRYWTAGQTNGFVHGLKYVVNPAAYATLAADPAVTIPGTASDAKVAQYADNYFEYSDDFRVTLEQVDGGSLATTFAYVEGTRQRLQQLAAENHQVRDGGQTIVYTNYAGQILLRERADDAGSAVTFKQYDDRPAG